MLAATAALGAIDIAPAFAAGGSISGTVTAANGGAPIQGLCVGAAKPGLDPVVEVSVATLADGTYTLSGVPAGTTTVKFYSSPTAGECPNGSTTNFVTQWWDNQPTIDTAQTINVTNGSSRTGVDAAMVVGGTITGTVTNANGGAGLNAICVLAYEDGVFHPPVLVAATATNPDGTYTLDGVPSGNLDVEFNSTGTCPGGSPSNFVTQWYNDKVEQATSDVVAVTAGTTTPNINAAMVPGGKITGKVTAAVGGAGVEGICVDVDVAADGGTPIIASVGVAKPDGSYELDGVPAGTVTVQFAVDGFCPGGTTCPYVEQWWNNTSAPGNDVNVTAGATTQNINAAMVHIQTNVQFSIKVNGSSTVATIAHGAKATLSETGLPGDATGTVVFSTSGNPNLCTINLPATSCTTSASLAPGSYSPIGAAFTDTDGAYNNTSSNNTVSLNVSAGAPGAPTNVHASRVGTTASVSWAAPADNGGAAITGYTVTASPGGKSVAAAANATHAMLNGVTAGTYTFTVKAKNSAGSATSASSNAVTFPVQVKVQPARAGYWMLGADGHVYNFGNAGRLGNGAGRPVAMTARIDGNGYWVVDGAGNVRAFGTAHTHGGHPALRAGESVSAISATPSGNGYWLFTNLGAAYAYGDAHFYGDMRAVHLNGGIIASAATATGHGYYMVGSDGGVFTFGDAKFHGSTGAMRLDKPVVGISPTPDNHGYWLVASDGGVFAFNAAFRGSMGGHALSKPVNGLVAFGNGYLMVASDGGIFNFSNKPFFGSLGGASLPAPIIGVTAFATK